MSIQIDLNIKANTDNLLEFQLAVVNTGEQALVIPQPEIVHLDFFDSDDTLVDWRANWFVSSDWKGIVLDPKGKTLYTMQISSVPNRRDQYQLVLNPGVYTVRYRLMVNDEYFDPNSHAGIKILRREAVRVGASVWMGDVSSNRVQVVRKSPFGGR